MKDRTAYKSCYKKKRRKNNNSLTQNQQPKIEDDNNKKKIKFVNSVKNKKKVNVVDPVNNNKNRTLIIGFSNCGKTYLRNHILFQKQDPIFLITKSINQYPKIKAQTSDEIEHLDCYENSIVGFDDMLLSKQESKIDLFLPEVVIIILIYTTYLKAIFISQKILFVISLT